MSSQPSHVLDSTDSLIAAGYEKASAHLIRELGSASHWVGELSSSALSTAVATIALGEMDRAAHRADHENWVQQGLQWLADHANPDGGWGDTPRSESNLSTTALVWAAFGASRSDARFSSVVDRAETWLWKRVGQRERLPNAIVDAYGDDRTFSVPILMTLALSGRLGEQGWREIPPLPFELALLPRTWFGALQLPVVSYALPALIAIGQTLHHHAPSRNSFARGLRDLARKPTLRLLEQLQPSNGGFLEATPLTAFVTMGLARIGEFANPVAVRGASFLRASIRKDGSWPIDTNLATWVSTLSIQALRPSLDAIPLEQRAQLRNWLLDQQYRDIHPYTLAAAGGWAWTDLPGGVPDADDTSGALLALKELGAVDDRLRTSVQLGIRWLMDLQNRDGGIPTFCRGWGTLPFDRSTPEITAHALRAVHAWSGELDVATRSQLPTFFRKALDYLSESQREDGAWVPLWFGNESEIRKENPVYGTSKVLAALCALEGGGVTIPDGLVTKAIGFLWSQQRPDGRWGGDRSAPASIEETSLAVGALRMSGAPSQRLKHAVGWLLESMDRTESIVAAPIGLYFARLWYYERLYPILFATEAFAPLDSNQR